MERIGDYDIRFEIGKGGFGRVYLGFDPRLVRPVAIKILNDGADADVVTRFRTEAKAAGNLTHPNIVTIYGYGEENGRPYIAMEYLDGRDLQHYIEMKLPLSLMQKLDILSQAADGLLCAHQNGVVHRDVKPANAMLLRDKTVKIMDFGIAKVLRDGAVRLTQSGFLVGTISYMAPEQVTNSEVDGLCDIWSYGVMAYELLTGIHPFRATDPGSLVYKITNTNPDPLPQLMPDCPEGLDRVVAKLLEKNRDKRYQSFDDVRFDLLPILRDLRRAEAMGLIPKVSELLQRDRLDEANTLLRQILDLDPANEQAQRLRESTQKHVQLRALRPRVSAHLRIAQAEAERRNFRNAVREVDSALSLIPDDEGLIQYRRELQAGWEAADYSTRLTAQARMQLDLLDLTGAFQIVNQAISADSRNETAQALRTEIRDRMEEREKRQQFRQDLSRAEVLMAISAFEDAGALLHQLSRESPDSTEVGALIARLEQQVAEEQKTKRLAEGIAESQRVLRSGNLDEAVEKIEALALEFPEEAQVRGLLALAVQEVDKRKLEQTYKSTCERAWRLVEKRDFDSALQAVEAGLDAYPGEHRLRELSVAIQVARSEWEKAQHLSDQLSRCRELRREGRLDEAFGLLETIRLSQGEGPELAAEREEVRFLISNRDRERAIAAAVERAQGFLENGQPDSAIHLLEQTIVSSGEATEVRHLLDSALEAREQAVRRKDLEDRIARIRAFQAAGELSASLALAEQTAGLYGPNAQVEAIAENVRDLQAVKELVQGIEQSISRGRWTEAKALLNMGAVKHPDETVWKELSDRLFAQQLSHDIEQNLRAKDFGKVREQIQEALTSRVRFTRLDAFVVELEEGESRQLDLNQARSLIASGDLDQAEKILTALLQRRPADSEADWLQREVRAEQEKRQRDTRIEEGRETARRFLAAQQFDDATRVIKNLLREYRGAVALEQDLEIIKAARERFDKQQTYHSVRSRAAELIAAGQYKKAIHQLEKLLADWQGDPGLFEQIAVANAALKMDQEKRAFDQEKDRVRQSIRRQKYETAMAALKPLLQGHPDDPDLHALWQSALAARNTRRDWLDVYEKVAELEDLYKKGKAAAVKEGAIRLLADIEQPRARQLLAWAEEVLALDPEAGESWRTKLGKTKRDVSSWFKKDRNT